MSALDEINGIIASMKAERATKAVTVFTPEEKSQHKAARQLAAVCSLINEATKLKEFLVRRVDTGRLYSDEEHIMLAMLESLSGLFDSNESIDDHMQRLRDNLGISDEDEEEDDGSYDLWKMAEGR